VLVGENPGTGFGRSRRREPARQPALRGGQPALNGGGSLSSLSTLLNSILALL
jgi:hypothetical protein